MERASFLVTKWVNALSGTGVGWADVTPFELPPPPDPPAAVVDARGVPLTEVFALEEMAVELAALDNTVELELTLDRADSADVEFTFDVANAVPILPAVSVELVLGGFRNDEEKCRKILGALKEIGAYNASLLDQMLAAPKLAALIPALFSTCFDTFPAEALLRCIVSPNIDQDALLFRLRNLSALRDMVCKHLMFGLQRASECREVHYSRSSEYRAPYRKGKIGFLALCFPIRHPLRMPSQPMGQRSGLTTISRRSGPARRAVTNTSRQVLSFG